MSDGAEVARLLGATQLFVFVASIGSEHLLASVTGSTTSSERLVNISKNLSRIRLSNLVALLNSLAIIVLAVLFYMVFSSQYELIALVALGFFLAEAITLAASKIGTLALVTLNQKYVAAGAPERAQLEAYRFYPLDPLEPGLYSRDDFGPTLPALRTLSRDLADRDRLRLVGNRFRGCRQSYSRLHVTFSPPHLS